jgi:cation transport ATPase
MGAPVLFILVVTAVSSLWRGEVGLDIVAALAMGGALAGGENLAGVVVAMMFAGGQALESYAQGSADREMKALLGRVARTAQLRRADRLETVPIEETQPGDRLLIRTGEAIPVDGFVTGVPAVLDESALTGEAAPVRHETGSAVASGVTNAGAPFDLEATQTAANSTYAGIVNLVEAARASKSPMSRLADRYALGFLAATVALAGGAWFLSTGVALWQCWLSALRVRGRSHRDSEPPSPDCEQTPRNEHKACRESPTTPGQERRLPHNSRPIGGLFRRNAR